MVLEEERFRGKEEKLCAMSSDTAPRLEVGEDSPQGGLRIVALRGELDMATVGGFEAALDRACRARPRTVVADLGEVTFIDSSGLAAMLGALRTLGLAGVRLVVACANPTVLRLFEVTGTHATFEIVATREQALARARAEDGDAPPVSR